MSIKLKKKFYILGTNIKFSSITLILAVLYLLYSGNWQTYYQINTQLYLFVFSGVKSSQERS